MKYYHPIKYSMKSNVIFLLALRLCQSLEFSVYVPFATESHDSVILSYIKTVNHDIILQKGFSSFLAEYLPTSSQ